MPVSNKSTRAGFVAPIVDPQLSSGSGRNCCCDCQCPDCLINTIKYGTADLSTSGIVVPASCIVTPASTPCSAPSASLQSVSMAVNGPFTLNGGTSSGPCCTWSSFFPSGGTIYDGCVGSPVTGSGFGWSLDKGTYPGYWKLLCTTEIPASGLRPLCYFVGTIAVPPNTNCLSMLTFSNDLTATGAYYTDPQLGCLIPLATGGTAIITF